MQPSSSSDVAQPDPAPGPAAKAARPTEPLAAAGGLPWQRAGRGASGPGSAAGTKISSLWRAPICLPSGLIAQVPAQQQEPEQVDEPRWRCAEPYCRRDLTNLTYFAVEPEEAGPDLVVHLAASKHSVLRTLAF